MVKIIKIVAIVNNAHSWTSVGKTHIIAVRGYEIMCWPTKVYYLNSIENIFVGVSGTKLWCHMYRDNRYPVFRLLDHRILTKI